MRRFSDADGVEWTVVLGKASYANMALLFSRAGSTDILCTPLEADSAAGARDVLREFADAELRERLAEARPWPLDEG